MQEEITATRAVMEKYPMIAALKAVIAHDEEDPEWITVRPPLVELSVSQRQSLISELDSRGFTMPGKAVSRS
jgi:4-hydroxy-tetrahydrodipicolinate synthase